MLDRAAGSGAKELGLRGAPWSASLWRALFRSRLVVVSEPWVWGRGGPKLAALLKTPAQSNPAGLADPGTKGRAPFVEGGFWASQRRFDPGLTGARLRPPVSSPVWEFRGSEKVGPTQVPTNPARRRCSHTHLISGCAGRHICSPLAAWRAAGANDTGEQC